jgi:hypothetical protein
VIYGASITARAQAIAQRHADKQKYREDINQREQQIHDRIQGLITSALARPRSEQFDLDQAFEELNEARGLALAISEPMAAARCTMFKAQLAGLVIERSAAVVGTPEQFSLQGDTKELKRQAVERLRERMGSEKANRLLTVLKREGMFKLDDDLIEIENDEHEEMPD